MKQEFITTGNTKKFEEICEEMTSATSLIGPSLAMVTGATGRGKTETAKHYAVHTTAVYIPPIEPPTRAVMFRKIAFDLTGLNLARSDANYNIIGDAMAKDRRLIIIDEADLLPMHVLEALRHLNENFACPILLIGEDGLKGKITLRPRIARRIRRRMEFGGINQYDIAQFFKMSLGFKIGPDITAMIQENSKGAWWPVLTAAINLERAMKTSDVKEITPEMVHDVLKNS